MYAVGGNEKAPAVRVSTVRRARIVVFAMSGLLAALGRLIHAGQLVNQGSPNDGAGYELDAIAAVVIGGTSLAGGRTMGGTLAGALLLGDPQQHPRAQQHRRQRTSS